MSANEFDELIRHKFDDTDIAYNPGNWEKMSQQLNNVQPPRKNNILFLGWPALGGIAAAMALVISLPILWLQNDRDNKNKNNNQSIAVTGEVRSTAPAIVEERNTTPVNINPNKTQLPVAIVRKQRAVAIAASAKPVIAANTNNETTPQVAINDNADSHTEPVAKTKTTTPKQKILLPEPVMDAPQAKTSRTTINLVGGFNYNSASAGYTIGASANRMLSEKLYIEGNLAYVNSSVGGNSPFPGGGFADNYDVAAGANGGKALEANKQPVQYNLNYLQFSPVMCYEVVEHFTLGAGPDIQQLLNRQTYYIQDLPALDVGVLGKAEFTISKKLKAGLQYRAGMNKAIQSKEYIDRNYMQVQMRYSIFHK